MLLGLLLAAVGLHAAMVDAHGMLCGQQPNAVISFTNADTTLAEWTQDACPRKRTSGCTA
jgi:hypothetical protein